MEAWLSTKGCGVIKLDLCVSDERATRGWKIDKNKEQQGYAKTGREQDRDLPDEHVRIKEKEEKLCIANFIKSNEHANQTTKRQGQDKNTRQQGA